MADKTTPNRKGQATERAEAAVEYLDEALNLPMQFSIPTALILGTGWGDALRLENERSVPFSEIPGLDGIDELSGHARQVALGWFENQPILLLRGRIHLNEAPAHCNLADRVRLQVEMLLQLGVTNLILTCAAGSLPGAQARVGDVVVIDSFMTLFAPEMPLFGGEFCSPEDILDPCLIALAKHVVLGSDRQVHTGCYAMVRGPFFEGRKRDKQALASAGADLVGMSILPEACVAAAYGGVKVLALALVTNDAIAEHDHERHAQLGRDSAKDLGSYLRIVLSRINVL